jgi:hypothetical protein
MPPVLNESRQPDAKEMPHEVLSHLSAADIRPTVWRVVNLAAISLATCNWNRSATFLERPQFLFFQPRTGDHFLSPRRFPRLRFAPQTPAR